MYTINKLLKRSRAGFTLVELLIVVAVFGLLVALGLFVSFQTYRTYDFQDEVTRVTTALQTARSRSMANVDGVEHGVCYEDAPSHSAYIIIAGDPCDGSAGQKIIVAEAVGVTWPNTITFDQLSGQANTTDITLTYEGKTATIQISSNGRINWVW